MNKITGVVQDVITKSTAVGPMYDIKVNGATYGAGKFPPKCRPGDSVEFEVTFRGQYANVTPRTLSVVSGPITQHSTVSTNAPQTTKVNGQSQWGADRQDIISRQAALNSALTFVDLAVRMEAIPNLKASMKPADRYEVLSGMVREKMQEFYTENTGNKYVSIAEKAHKELDEGLVGHLVTKFSNGEVTAPPSESNWE